MSRAPQAYVWTRDRWSTRAREWLVYAAAHAFRLLTWPVGTWTLAAALAPAGGLVALAVPGFRRRAEENLALVWPHLDARARRAIVAEAGRQFLRLMVEYGQLDRMTREVEIETSGMEHLEAVTRSGRGAVILSAHYGNWEAVRIAARRADIEVGILYRAFNNRYLDRFGLGLIPCAGAPVLHKGPAGLREMMRHVKAGGVVMVLADQRNSGAPFIDFLGHPAETPTSPAEIAARSGAALLTARGRRDVGARRFAVEIGPPVEAENAEAAMAEVNARIGRWIVETPGQWLWFHRRWRATRRSRPR